MKDILVFTYTIHNQIFPAFGHTWGAGCGPSLMAWGEGLANKNVFWVMAR